MQGNHLPDEMFPELRLLMAVLAVAEVCYGTISLL